MSTVIDTVDSLITGPVVEPLDLDEVKKALRFTSTTDDTLIDMWISAARQHFEEQTGRQCITATRELWLDAFPTGGVVELPYPPLQSVVSITYDDAASNAQTMDVADYVVSAPHGETCARGRVVLASGASWPASSTRARSVRIRFTCGYGDAPGAVPELVKAALYFLVGHFHKFRAEVHEQQTNGSIIQLPFGAEAILRAFTWTALPTLQPRTDTIWNGTTWV